MTRRSADRFDESCSRPDTADRFDESCSRPDALQTDLMRAVHDQTLCRQI